jgi:hypothetical protein
MRALKLPGPGTQRASSKRLDQSGWIKAAVDVDVDNKHVFGWGGPLHGLDEEKALVGWAQALDPFPMQQ